MGNMASEGLEGTSVCRSPKIWSTSFSFPAAINQYMRKESVMLVYLISLG